MSMLEPYICYPVRVNKTVNTPSFTKQGVFTFGSTFFHKTKRIKEILLLFERLNLDNFGKFKEFVKAYGISCFLTKDDRRVDITKTGSKDSIRKISEMSGYLKEVSESWLKTFWKNNRLRLKSEQKELRKLIKKYYRYRIGIKEYLEDPERLKYKEEANFLKKIFGRYFKRQHLALINSKLSGYYPRFIKISKVDKDKFKEIYLSRAFQHFQNKGDRNRFHKIVREISPSSVISSSDVDIVTRCYAELCEWISNFRSPRKCAYLECRKYFVGRKNRLYCSDKCQKAVEYLKSKTRS